MVDLGGINVVDRGVREAMRNDQFLLEIVCALATSHGGASLGHERKQGPCTTPCLVYRFDAVFPHPPGHDHTKRAILRSVYYNNPCARYQSLNIPTRSSSISPDPRPCTARWWVARSSPAPPPPLCCVQVMEYWESDVVPDIRAGKRVIVVAHANTLRSLVKR